jgi:ubiquinone/menaquinone biosynthesis C-methylase UbiE
MPASSLDSDKAFTGAIPALYDRHLGPMIFEPYAADLAARVTTLGARRVLETAAGTGIVTRAVHRSLPARASILATDLNQAMLDHAREQLRADNVEWRQADATALPFENSSFDAVICQFGAMFFPSKSRGFSEARRVLCPDGTYIFNVWDRLEANEVALVVHEAVASLFPGDPPQFLQRTPHGYHDIGVIRDELARAGFSRIEVETVERRGHAPSHRDPALGFCLGSPLRNEIEARGAGQLDRAVESAAAALAARFGKGPIEARLRAHVFTAAF